MSRGKSVTYVLGTLSAITHNESHVCDVAPSPTRARGHVAERRAAAPRSPRRPAGAAMYIRAVIRSCAIVLWLQLDPRTHSLHERNTLNRAKGDHDGLEVARRIPILPLDA